VRRILLAFLAAAVAFPGTIVLLDVHHVLGGLLKVAGLLFAIFLACGFPLLFLFCRRQWWSPWRFLLGGMLGGGLCALPFAGAGSFSFVYLAILFAMLGLVVATLFWFAGVWRNDNLTCPREFRLPGGTTYRVARDALRR
jgi:hypothetical protein